MNAAAPAYRRAQTWLTLWVAGLGLLGLGVFVLGRGDAEGAAGALPGALVLAACVIGGTALKGGRGTVWGVLLGALIMTVLLNGMTLMAVSPEVKFIARGTVLALAVWMDVRFSRR